MIQGRPQLYDLRILEDRVNAGRREESIKLWQTLGWRCFWRCRPDVHISTVRILPVLYKYERLILRSDVLRRRFQINKMKSMGYKYKSIWDAVRIIAAEEGLRGFYKGIIPNLLKVAPSMASSFLSFELARDFFVSLGDDDV